MGEPVRDIARRQEQSPAPQAKDRNAPPRKSVVREYGEAFLIALLLALVIRTFLVQAYKIPSGSMEPTLLIGDHILVNKLIYGFRTPDSLFGLHPPGIPYGKYLFNLEPIHRGDVVVFVFPPDPTKDFIKRVVALGGDTVEVKGRAVFVNGVKQDDPHAYYQTGPEAASTTTPKDTFGPVKVPEGQIFVMGDNRDRSYDSRFWGFVDHDKVEGKALVIYWSWDSDSSALFPIRLGRFGKLVE